MSELKGKIDFTLFVSANGANVNGDPLNRNRPRINLDGYGEMSDVCIKRKIRNRLQDLGQKIFVQSDDRTDDSFKSLKERADGCEELKKQMGNKKDASRDLCAQIACREWIDVRAFGQVFAFKGIPVSFGVRGPVSIHQAVSLSPIDIMSMQITKSVNSEAGKEGKASDTMGTKHRVGFAVYKVMGSVNVQLAEKTGFTQEDAEILKEALMTLFENDASSARPEGSMEVCRMYWWQHEEKTPAISSGKIQRGFDWNKDLDHPRSFKDSNGDGIGDLRGVIDHLDYLKSLGIDIIWLSPIYQSPFVDQGYDISDYYKIDEIFGTMEEFDELLAEAKKRDMYIIMDLVINHCSDQHEWFQKALKDPEGKYGDYFYFRKGKDGNPPSNYRSYFGGSAWEKVEGTDYYYLHMFAKEQPDLNWNNPEVLNELYTMINWWLDKGLAGFRIDAIINIKKDLSFPNYEPDGPDGMTGIFRMVEGVDGVGELLEDLKKQLRAHLKS